MVSGQWSVVSGQRSEIKNDQTIENAATLFHDEQTKANPRANWPAGKVDSAGLIPLESGGRRPLSGHPHLGGANRS